ncbi:MAG: sigma-70 family RNA polymerase sigma factor [Acidimicrobiia bacterium]|nr:sigma-70 family RNA polymerase sigma factor [Acidimicrobiia bacterium]
MARDGGDGSFEAAYRELFPRAATLAYRLLGQRAAAEDVAAEAMARTYAHWRQVSRLPHRDAWVLRVATNLAIDASRRRRVPPGLQEPLDVEEAATVRIALVAALESLPRRQRQVVALRYLSGLREDEVATALGVSTSTASTHLRRGLDALRGRLGDAFTEQGLCDA